MRPDPDPTHPAPGMHIWGWMTPVELYWLRDTAATVESVVEVGCLHGRSAYALLEGCPGPVYCVDPWTDDDGNDAYQSFLSSCGHFPNLRAQRTTSTEAARIFALDPVETVDMVFLDGDHEYESVLVDIATWLPLTRRILCGHDYANADDGYPGVRRAVTEVFGDRAYRPDGTSIWVVDVAADRTVAPGLPTSFSYVDGYGRQIEAEVSW